MAGAKGIVLSRDPSKLQSHGGHLNITKGWAKSFLIHMGFVKCKCSNASKVLVEQFYKLKEVFLANGTAKVLISDTPKSLSLIGTRLSCLLYPQVNGQWRNGMRR